jgi:(p)ppGpp synthase/HD superfamily hydrolase
MSARLHSGLQFAVKAHAGQDREGEMPPPYVCHPVEVMLNLRYVGGVADEDLMVVALLHDTIEESNVTLKEIQSAFGDRVATLVQELTRYEPTSSETKGLSKPEIWQLRSDFLLKEIGGMSADAQKIKLADRLSNVREAKRSKSPAKLKRYLAQTEKILEIIPRDRNPSLWDAIKAEAH